MIFALRLLFRQSPFRRNDYAFLGAVAAVVLVLGTGPAWLSYYAQGAVRDALVFAIFALSFDLLWGKSNMLSLGHATFFGLGAYGYAITSTKLGWTALPAISAGLGAAAAVACVVGYFLIFAGVRLHFFAVISIAVLLIIAQIAISWTVLTGGDVGLLGIPSLEFDLLGLDLGVSGSDQTYYFALGLMLAVLLLLWLATRGYYGRLLAAVGMNELRAKTFGIDTSVHLLIVFVVSAMIAALSGAVYSSFAGVVGPDLFSPIFSLEVVLWVAIGGRGSLLGPVVATVILTRFQQEVSSYSTSLWPLILGSVFLLMVLFLPGGLKQLGASLARLSGWWRQPGGEAA